MIYSLGDRHPILEGGEHFIADNATVVGSVRLKSQVSLWFNCVLRGDNDWIEIGQRSNIQDGCVLHVDDGFPLTVGHGVTVGHKAMLHGCTIGSNCLIGIGSAVLNGAKLGSNCVVGAHALITEDKEFPDGSLILGAPAKIVRELSAEEIAKIGKSADEYIGFASRYRRHLRPSTQ